MPVSTTYKPKKDCPDNIDDLRKALTALAKKKSGGKLISQKFTKDHIFSGHNGDLKKLGAQLAKLRNLAKSTIMITSMTSTAQAEVLNWIKNVPASKLTYNSKKKEWTISTSASSVSAAKSYKFATVDLDALKGMNGDDVVKKSRKWMKETSKTPKVACQFDGDGTPVIYHLDY